MPLIQIAINKGYIIRMKIDKKFLEQLVGSLSKNKIKDESKEFGNIFDIINSLNPSDNKIDAEEITRFATSIWQEDNGDGKISDEEIESYIQKNQADFKNTGIKAKDIKKFLEFFVKNSNKTHDTDIRIDNSDGSYSIITRRKEYKETQSETSKIENKKLENKNEKSVNIFRTSTKESINNLKIDDEAKLVKESSKSAYIVQRKINYNSNNQIISIEETKDNVTTIKDKNGKLLSIIVKKEGTKDDIYEYCYLEDGTVEESYYYGTDGKKDFNKPIISSIYKNDKLEDLIKECKYNCNGNKIQEINYKDGIATSCISFVDGIETNKIDFSKEKDTKSKETRYIQLFPYVDSQGSTKWIQGFYGQKWSEIKTDNETLNLIISSVDNGDEIIQPRELNLLNKIFIYISHLQTNEENNMLINNNKLDIIKNGKDSKKLLYTLNKTYNSRETKISALEQLFETDDKNTNVWQEGLERSLGTIYLCGDYAENDWLNSTTIAEMKKFAEELGIKIETIHSGKDIWIEDSSIRRADGKKYIPFHSNIFGNTSGKYTSVRGNVSSGGGSRVATDGNSFDLQYNPEEIYYGTSYLEGGNVLNTFNADGQPAAIIGESSITYSLTAMGLQNTPDNVEKVKKQIAEDLGLDVQNVTYIPQFDFHIDMLYHPFLNGQIAVPDFDEAIRILRENNIESMDEESKKQRISRLEKLRDDTRALREEAEDNLIEAGYKIVRIPYFSVDNEDRTNYMNGVCGTSPNGTKILITNTSEYPELNSIIEPYFTSIGVEQVLFANTQSALILSGGIDCLTQEFN